ncbi:MAG TPA: amino acid racemase [Telluria sp.]|nr:amino acid racemase [Telluria sp.]
MHSTLGVLGGMGPLATADFYRKIVEETDAHCDQEHIPVLVYSLPDIPCRSTAIMDRGRSPLPRMIEGLRKLEQAKVEAIAIPCNTAHYWYRDLCKATSLPILHIVDAVAVELQRMSYQPRHLGLLATESTLAARIYHDRLAGHGYSFTVNAPDDREKLVVRAINLVKQGRPQEGGHLLELAVRKLLDRGVEAPILACTELPVALESIGSSLLSCCVDASRALAKAAVAWSTERAGMPAMTRAVLAPSRLAPAQSS